MPPKFGTSGLRGLVTELTPDRVGGYVAAFIASCPVGKGLYVAHDLRPSSPQIAMTVAQAAQKSGLDVTICGPVPTPALALAAMNAGSAAIMVTGSHIPADRNGLKFYTPQGEITKAHEQRILAALGGSDTTKSGRVISDDTAGGQYIARYTRAYGTALNGMRIGLYGHSAVGREGVRQLLTELGATVVSLGWSSTFVPVDTEAVDADLRVQLRQWAAQHDVVAIVSTDGDGDRPLLTDAAGNVVPGDILGQITAESLGAQTVVTPISSNTGVTAPGKFAQVIQTKIGSPYVIAAMESADGKKIGYEANGGFLLGFMANGPAGQLQPLMTRDAMLPLVAVLAAARELGVADLVAAQPKRFTAADRLQDVPAEASRDLVASLLSNAEVRTDFLAALDGVERNLDLTDGLRITLADERIIHIRPSGNAPELRLYVEADSTKFALSTLSHGLALLKRYLAA